MTFRRRIAVFIGILGISCGLAFSLATAQNDGGGGNGLQLIKTRTEISGAKGEQKTFSFSIKNITKSDLKLKAVLNDFESDGVSGTPRIIVDTRERNPYSLARMLQGLEDIELKADETKEVKFTADIPGDAAPGAYYGAIRYQVVPRENANDEERQIALNASVAHLVFLEIPGEINEQIQVESLKVLKGEKSGSFFLSSPNKVSVAVKNLGNGFSRPFGTVNVNYFSKEAYSYDVNKRDPRGIVLPNSSRTFTDDVKNISKPGKYNVIASVAYGSGGEVVSYKTSFWYVPVWVFVILALLLIVIGVGISLLYRKKFSRRKQ